MRGPHGANILETLVQSDRRRILMFPSARGLAVLLMAIVPASGTVLAQGPGVPPLPRLALDLYPPAARESVAAAHTRASRHPQDADAAGAYGRVLQAWEQLDAAHDAYARARSLAPKTFDWWYLDGFVLQRLARHEDAAACFRQAVALRPEYLPARLKLLDELFATGASTEARALAMALLAEPRGEPVAHFYLGRLAAGEGDHAGAVEHLTRAIQLFPAWGGAHYALALSYRALGRADDARAAMALHAQYGNRWPGVEEPLLDGVAALRDDARALLVRGLRLADAGDIAGAIAAHEEALARDPSLPQAHSNLISLYGRAGDTKKAEEHYRTAVKLGMDTADTHYDYGVLLGMQQQWDAAAEAYRRAIAKNALHPRAHNNLGEILERQRNVEGALQEYRAAASSQAGFRLARFNTARMLLALGRTEDAVAELQQILEPRDAEAPRYFFALAVAHVRAGRKSEGRKWAAEARALAVQHGQSDLAAAIDRELAKLQ
jgi:tetratricopeptide (TPR) repeat protein